MKELVVDAVIENVRLVTDCIVGQLEEHGFTLSNQMQVAVVIDELFSNIVNYAYEGVTGKVKVRFLISETYDAMKLDMIFIDSGVPYNPLTAKEPDITLSAEDRQPGGLGIHMVKRLVDEICYDYIDNENILTIVKHLEKES